MNIYIDCRLKGVPAEENLIIYINKSEIRNAVDGDGLVDMTKCTVFSTTTDLKDIFSSGEVVVKPLYNKEVGTGL